MLTDAESLLVSAAVDGELSPREESAFHDLVADSPAAAELYTKLYASRIRLNAMPRALAPEGMANFVFDHLPVRIERKPSLRPMIRPPFAVAAAVLFAVSAGSFWVSSGPHEPQPVAVRTVPTKSSPVHKDAPTVVVQKSDEVPVAPSPRLVPPQEQLASLTPTVEPPVAPLPRKVEDTAFGAAVAPATVPLTAVDVRLPALAAVADFDRDDVQARFVEALTAEQVHRLDLFARDPHRAVEVFTAAAFAGGVKVSVDAVALERMKRKLPTGFAVAVESLTPAEVVRLIAKLQPTAKAEGSLLPGFASAHLLPAEPKDWKDVFGIDLTAKRAKPAGTLGEVTAALAKPAEKAAVVAVYQPVSGRSAVAGSKELKAFADQRGERKPGTVSVMIVIRPVN